MDEEEELNENGTQIQKQTPTAKKVQQFAKLEQIVKEMNQVDNHILLSEMNKIIKELKQVSNE